MRNRVLTTKIVIGIVLGLAIVAIPVGAFFGSMWYIESSQVQDADPAFLPLVPLGVVVWSNPTPFSRYCIYVAEFPPGAELCDGNIDHLACLNALPVKNELDLLIRTPRVTDASLPQLEAIGTIDVLDVTGSSISDAGIARLSHSMRATQVIQRKSALGRTNAEWRWAN